MSSDIEYSKIIFRKTPKLLHPYIKIARLDRPIGTWLLLLPCWWSIILAKKGALSLGAHDIKTIILFALGALLMRSAGCIINDLTDKELDAKVARTKTRPLPAKELGVKSALVFLALLLFASLLILLTLPKTAVILGFVSIIPIVIYPHMKRVTYLPQLFLGLTFNWGALLGWAAIENNLSLASAILYAGGICWTLSYDTIYAHQDKDDDAIVGIKSTALLFADKSKTLVALFHAISLLLVIAAKYICTPSLLILPAAVPALLFIIWQSRNWDYNNPQSCLKHFKANMVYGLLVLLIMAV